MKKGKLIFGIVGTVFSVGILLATLEGAATESKVKGLIPLEGVSPSMYPTLAAVKLSEAAKLAQAKVPGEILSVGLENEEGTLVYEVQVIDSASVLHEVLVDAGNGKILSTEVKGPATKAKVSAHEGDDENEDD